MMILILYLFFSISTFSWSQLSAETNFEDPMNINSNANNPNNDYHDNNDDIKTIINSYTILENSINANEKCNSQSIEDYFIYHHTMISSDKLFHLIHIPHASGIADRLTGGISIFLLALLTNRVFQFGNINKVISFYKVLDPYKIAWNRSNDPTWITDPLHEGANPKQLSEEIIQQGHYYAMNLIGRDLKELYETTNINETLTKNEQVFISSNHGISIKLFSNSIYAEKLKSFGFTKDNIFGCSIQYLFKPKMEIFQPIQTELQLVSSNIEANNLVIGIQIRVGDRTWESNRNQQDHYGDEGILQKFHRFFDCATAIESLVGNEFNQSLHPVWLLNTDSKRLRHEAKEKWGDKIISSLSAKVEHSAKEFCHTEECHVSFKGFSTSMAEWWIFGYAHYFVVSEESGFGKTSAMRSLRPSSIFDPESNCNKLSDTLTPDGISDQWAGL